MGESVIAQALKSRLADGVQDGDGKYRCRISFDRGFCGFDGHFEGNPIVPGVCIIEAVRCAAEQALEKRLTMKALSQCRFRAPLLPGDRADIALVIREKDGVQSVSGDISNENGIICRLRMELAAL